MLHTNAKSHPLLQAYLAQVNVFCSALRAVPAEVPTAVNAIRLTSLQESRPTTWAPAPPGGPAVYFEAEIVLSHPSVTLPERAVTINGRRGTIDSISPTGVLCSACLWTCV